MLVSLAFFIIYPDIKAQDPHPKEANNLCCPKVSFFVSANCFEDIDLTLTSFVSFFNIWWQNVSWIGPMDEMQIAPIIQHNINSQYLAFVNKLVESLSINMFVISTSSGQFKPHLDSLTKSFRSQTEPKAPQFGLLMYWHEIDVSKIFHWLSHTLICVKRKPSYLSKLWLCRHFKFVKWIKF